MRHKVKPMDPQATRQTKFGINLYGFCVTCGEPKEENNSRTCRGCYHASRKGKSFGQSADSEVGLSKGQMSEEQWAVYRAIMGRRRTAEARQEALGMVSRATSRGELAQELEFWTVEAPEGPHKMSSLALMVALAPGAIA